MTENQKFLLTIAGSIFAFGVSLIRDFTFKNYLSDWSMIIAAWIFLFVILNLLLEKIWPDPIFDVTPYIDTNPIPAPNYTTYRVLKVYFKNKRQLPIKDLSVFLEKIPSRDRYHQKIGNNVKIDGYGECYIDVANLCSPIPLASLSGKELLDKLKNSKLDIKEHISFSGHENSNIIEGFHQIELRYSASSIPTQSIFFDIGFDENHKPIFKKSKIKNRANI